MRLLSLWVLLLAVTACAVPPPASSDVGVPSLLRFKPASRTVEPDLLNHLGQAAGARIDYQRAMSGDAHVVTITPLAGRSYEEVLKRLRADPVIDYVEPDAVMRIQR